MRIQDIEKIISASGASDKNPAPEEITNPADNRYIVKKDPGWDPSSMNGKFTYTVTAKDEADGASYKDLVRWHFSFSRRLLTKLKKEDLVYINGQRIPMYKPARTGDVITVLLPEERSDFLPEPIKITPVYEDEDLLIINKQPGYVVHPTKGHPVHTMANGIMQYMIDTGQSFKIRFINRLDMDTSGLLAVAKNSHSQDELTKQMKTGSVRKTYKAIVKGIVTDDEGTIDAPIGRPEAENVVRAVIPDGYPSVTHYKVLERYEKAGCTLVQLLLETGRTHQIRVHMSYIGHPVLGDQLYGGQAPLYIDRQALHAAYLTFKHPMTGKTIDLEAPLPQDILNAIKKLQS